MVLTFECVDEILKVVLTFESVNEILKCDHSNDRKLLSSTLGWCCLYYALQFGCYFLMEDAEKYLICAFLLNEFFSLQSRTWALFKVQTSSDSVSV